jgi:hypothetical protein
MIHDLAAHTPHRLFVAILVVAALMVFTVAAKAEVTISDKPTRAMKCADGVCAPTEAKANLDVVDLANMLSSRNTEVLSDSAAMDIRVTAPLTWTSTKRLILTSYHSISVERPVTIAGKGALTVSPAQGDGHGTVAYSKKGNFTFWDLSSKLVMRGVSYQLVSSIASLSAAVSKNPSGNYALANDYDASQDGDYPQAPVATAFSGKAEGLGHTISNLTIDDKTDGDDVGLFAFATAYGLITNLRLVQVRVSGGSHSHAGALLGDGYGFVSAVSVSGSVSTGDNGYAGGIVGGGDSITVVGSQSSAAVTGGHATIAGGIGGSLYSVYDSSSSGPVSILDGAAGGLVGNAGYRIDTSRASGNVTATAGHSSVGGLAAGFYEIDDSSAAGRVTGGEDSVAGGLAAFGPLGLAYGTFSTGPVSVTGKNGIAGGLVGRTEGNILYSYATGTVDSGKSGMAGGLVGLYSSSAQMTSSYSTASIKRGKYRGGIAGFAEATDYMTYIYWDLDSSGINDLAQGCGNRKDCTGIGLSDAQLKSGLPTGFDPDIWGQQAAINNGYPYLLANPPAK